MLATGVPTNLSTSGGNDTVNVGNAGSVQGILGALNVQNPPSFDTINVNDSADATARTVTLSTFTSGGLPWGAITGLAPAAINYRYGDTTSVSVTTGTRRRHGQRARHRRADQPEHQRRPRHGQRGQRRQRAGHPRHPERPEPAELRHDQRQRLGRRDGADRDAQHLHLGRLPWGSITGLAPAAINYRYGDTTSVSVTTGSGADTVNVLATGVPTNLSTSGGNDTVNVGNAGSVQGILGALNVQNPPSFDTINVNDSADLALRSVVINTVTPFNRIIGLAPATIEYKAADASSVTIFIGPLTHVTNNQTIGVPIRVI